MQISDLWVVYHYKLSGDMLFQYFYKYMQSEEDTYEIPEITKAVIYEDKNDAFRKAMHLGSDWAVGRLVCDKHGLKVEE